MSECSVPVCDRPVKCKGYCQGHYARSRNGGDLTTPLIDSLARRRPGSYHGTPSGYTNNGCRCEPCREAMSRRYRELRGGTPPRLSEPRYGAARSTNNRTGA